MIRKALCAALLLVLAAAAGPAAFAQAQKKTNQWLAEQKPA